MKTPKPQGTELSAVELEQVQALEQTLSRKDTALAERQASIDRIEKDLGMKVAVTDTIMTDDAAAERVARVALELLQR